MHFCELVLETDSVEVVNKYGSCEKVKPSRKRVVRDKNIESKSSFRNNIPHYKNRQTTRMKSKLTGKILREVGGFSCRGWLFDVNPALTAENEEIVKVDEEHCKSTR